MNIFDLPVHPAADVFPMIPRDELEELAADIAENGLINPLVVHDGHLIDGRNRREACRIAGIEPDVVGLAPGVSAKAYIISSNINRRHMTKGQRAMAVAMIYPDGQERGRGKKSLFSNDISGAYVRQARTVLKHLPDLANEVLAGTKMLSDSYSKAVDVKRDAENGVAALDRLRMKAPDLADLVVEERMTLKEAQAALEAREEQEKVKRQGQASALYKLADSASIFANDKNVESLADYAANFPDEYKEFSKRSIDMEVKSLKVIAGKINKLIKLIEDMT